MLNKSEIYEAEITDYTAEGQGVAHVEGCAVFVSGAILGERYRLKLTKVAKTWAAGRIEEILVRSPHRVPRACPQGKRCGGCDFWHMDYEAELSLKAARVRDALNRLGGEELETVPILGSEAQAGYRNKAQYPVAMEGGKAVAGFFQAGTHRVIPVERCAILPPEMDRVKDAVLAYMNTYRVPAYDEATGKGLVRHIYVRKAFGTGQLLCCLVVNGDKLPRQRELSELLKERVPELTTLVLSENRKKGNTVLGDRFRTIFGPGYLEDTLCGLRFRLSPRSFYQVNRDQAQRLYETAMELAEISKTDTVLDLYCGAGTITLSMAARAGRVIGVEIVEAAVQDARDNADRNGIQNAEFFCADAGQAAQELERRGLRPDVITVDPPRKGLSPDVIDAVDKMDPRRLVYISCDPATLARDVALFKERGYALRGVEALDLFPRCAHVETVVLLSKGEIDSKKVRVEFSLEDMDMSGFQKGATYEQIKAYVLEHTGLKVSSLYISQIKRKCGLDVGQNYNLSKKEDAKVPKCPPEKEAAIRDALKYFQMI